MLDGCLAGRDPDELYPAVRAAGRLPHGPAGDVLFRRLGAQVRQLASTAGRALCGAAPEALEVACEIDGRQLTGRLPRVTPSGCLQVRCAKLSARDFLQAWVGHLVLQVARPSVREPESFLIGLDKRLRLIRVRGCRRRAGAPARLYRRGLTEPVHLSRSAPWRIVSSCARLRTRRPGSRSAGGTARRTHGEGADPYVRLFHPAAPPWTTSSSGWRSRCSARCSTTANAA